MNYSIGRHEKTKGYSYLPNYKVDRSVLRQEDLIERSGYQQQDHVNCRKTFFFLNSFAAAQ